MVLRLHDVDGAPLLAHALPLGMGAALERRRWQAALDEVPSVFDEAARARWPLALFASGGAAAALLVAARLARACGRGKGVCGGGGGGGGSGRLSRHDKLKV